MAAIADRTFEEVYRELEKTVQRLEQSDLPLAESLALFERSTFLAEQCNTLLDQAELRVRQLVTGADGSIETQPFANWQDN